MNYIQLTISTLILLLVTYVALKQRTPRIKKTSDKSVLLDSSALIDGRVIEVAKNGFLPETVIVPSSVLREMQYLADNADHDKRSRARHGLDVVKELQLIDWLTVTILNDGLPGEGGVDERLVQLSKTYGFSLLTLDFNLNKVADAEGIKVLNINQLAQSLRMSYLPGEKRFLTLVQKGQDSNQAVGYLEDGTMVVVENAGRDVGESIEVEFTRALQTQAGKMLFAKKLGTSAKGSYDKTARKNNSSSKQSSPKKDSTTQPKQQPQKQAQSEPKPTVKPPQAPNRQRNRRRTPEDSLVELANK